MRPSSWIFECFVQLFDLLPKTKDANRGELMAQAKGVVAVKGPITNVDVPLALYLNPWP